MDFNTLNPMHWGRRSLPVRRTAASPALPSLSNFDRFFDDFWNEMPMFSMPALPMEPRSFVPSIDVSETDKELKIDCELPGMDDKDIDISLCGNTLCISGEKKTETEEKDKGMYRSERTYGSFSRSLELPTGLDTDKITADFKNGVLTVKLPKTEEYKKQTKRIPIARPETKSDAA